MMAAMYGTPQAVKLLIDIVPQDPKSVAKVTLEMAKHQHPLTRVHAATVLAGVVRFTGVAARVTAA